MNNTALDLIKQLRAETGAGVQDCRKALEANASDFAKALSCLRAQGLEKAAKRADRPVLQGIVEVYSHGSGRVGVMVEVCCETDFAANSPAFRLFAHEIALQVAAAAPLFACENDIPSAVLDEEVHKAKTRFRQEGKPDEMIDRIIPGVLEKFKDRNVLLRQKYIRDDAKTIEQLLHQAVATVRENIVIRRIVRWEVGEDLTGL